MVIYAVGNIPAQSAKFKREYKMQVVVGPNTYWGIGATKFAEMVKEKTQGKIHIKQLFYSCRVYSGEGASCGKNREFF